MSIPQSAGGPIGSRDDLVRYLESGNKPSSEWRIGTEHEKFVYNLKTHVSSVVTWDQKGDPSLGSVFIVKKGSHPIP